MRRARAYRIFGKTVRVEVDDSLGGRVLEKELAIYPTSDSLTPDLSFSYGPVSMPSEGLINPSVHMESVAGFLARYPTADVRFRFEEGRLTGAEFQERGSGSIAHRVARRWMDIQFAHRSERTGMIFHELVLIPAICFIGNLVPIHASAFADRSGRVTLLGGTGGVGKTSLQLELCMTREQAFVADDFAVIDSSGHVWPNLSYPKIYAYNTADNPALLEGLRRGNRGLADLHWHLHKRRGLDKVRRRIAPDRLYRSHLKSSGPLHRLVMLVRTQSGKLEHRSLDIERAVELCLAAVQPELSVFLSHLHWQTYNRIAGEMADYRDPQDVIQRWRSKLTQALSNVTCEIIKIPAGMEHAAFKRQVADLLVGR